MLVKNDYRYNNSSDIFIQVIIRIVKIVKRKGMMYV